MSATIAISLPIHCHHAATAATLLQKRAITGSGRVDGAEQPTYVAERHLESDERGQPITHSWVAELCGEFQEGRYFLRSRLQ